jgi:hypothetical protein
MEVDPRLSKPSGPSVLEDLPDAVHDALCVDLFDEIPAVTARTKFDKIQNVDNFLCSK